MSTCNSSDGTKTLGEKQAEVPGASLGHLAKDALSLWLPLNLVEYRHQVWVLFCWQRQMGPCVMPRRAGNGSGAGSLATRSTATSQDP